MLGGMSDTTRAKWRVRVREWRESGESADRFVVGRGFSVSALRAWAARLRRAEEPRFLQLVSRTDAVGSDSEEIVVEVAGARIRVRSGFDAVLLAEVVRAVSAGGR